MIKPPHTAQIDARGVRRSWPRHEPMAQQIRRWERARSTLRKQELEIGEPGECVPALGCSALGKIGSRERHGALRLGDIWNAAPGNTYFMDWDGDRVINHVAAVTARTSRGIPRISQKTANRHNMLLTTWKAKVDDSHPKVKWYGLRRTT